MLSKYKKTAAFSGVYAIENKKTYESYVGSSVNLYKRKISHFSVLKMGDNKSKKLQDAYNKFGRESFEFKVVLYCEPNEMWNLEREAIKAWRSTDLGYNTCSEPGREFEVMHTESSNLKRSKAMKGRVFSESHNENIASAHRGRPLSPEHRAAISATKKKQNTEKRAALAMAC